MGDNNYLSPRKEVSSDTEAIDLLYLSGGNVDKADHDPRWATYLNYTPTAGSPPLHNEICAIREAFEESGVLLSDPPTELSNEEIKVWREKVYVDLFFTCHCDVNWFFLASIEF